MRAISLWQPWASLWASGRKVHETRHWPTDYRGPLVIHAAKRVEPIGSIDPDLFDLVCRVFGDDWRRQIPYGALVGTVSLVACKMVRVSDTGYIPLAAHQDDVTAGNWAPGRFAWQGEKFRMLSTPIPWRGRQGFFSVPDSIIREAA